MQLAQCSQTQKIILSQEPKYLYNKFGTAYPCQTRLAASKIIRITANFDAELSLAYQPSAIPEEEFSGVGGYFISFHISINSRVATPYNLQFKSLVTKPGCCPVWLVWVLGLLCGAFLPAWPPWSACCCCWLFTRCSSGTWLTPCQGTSMCWFILVLLVI